MFSKIRKFFGPKKLAEGNKIVVNCEKLETRVALLESGSLEEYTVERANDENIVGSIFKGIVRNIEPGLNVSARLQKALVQRIDSGKITQDSRTDFRKHEVNILSGDRVLGNVHVGFSLIQINEELQKSIIRNILLAILFIFLSSTLSFFLSRRMTGPLERLSNAMAAIRTSLRPL